MRHRRRPYLPMRPALLLTPQLPYDHLLRNPEEFAEGFMDVLSEVLKVGELQGLQHAPTRCGAARRERRCTGAVQQPKTGV